MAKSKGQVLRHISDPGHGWVEVPVDLCKKLRLGSDYPTRGNFFYLEEDDEATRLDRALKKHKLPVTFAGHEVDDFDSWLSGQQLGMLLLEQARAAGASLLGGRVQQVLRDGGRVSGVRVATTDGRDITVHAPVFVNAAGPYAKQVGALLDVSLPLFSEAHYKIAIEDTLGVVDRNTGLVILDDDQSLEWSDEEHAELAADDDTRWLTEPLPAGIHLRPEGYGSARTVLMLWDYHSAHRFDAPEFPLPDDPFYPEVVLRGMTKLAPGLSAYLERLPHAYVDGGYYTKTVENRPLVGPLGIDGAYVCAAFSGFGLMAAPAAAELLAAQITGASRPSYESAFLLARYEDAAYRAKLVAWGSTGQL